MWKQETYQKAIDFAARAHGDQKVPGKSYSYVVHLSNVAMEVMAAIAARESRKASGQTSCAQGNEADAMDDAAVACAVLHDTLEDTGTPREKIETVFGKFVADGVAALTKNGDLEKKLRMADSLRRIAELPPYAGMVKLADRITNLQEPPERWSREKIAGYAAEAKEILAALGRCDEYLATRLASKIEEYSKYYI